jgi:predicted secreted protein
VQRIAYVTGSNGFLGINLCAELIRQDWRVKPRRWPAIAFAG